MTKLSDLRRPIIGTRHGNQPANEADHFHAALYAAKPSIGDLRQVIWHEQPGYQPLEMDA